jgi:hypothetical protein
MTTVHDTRNLCTCAQCQRLADKTCLIPHADGFWHGRCYITAFGLARFLRLPSEVHDELTLGDIGAHAMQAVLAARRNRAADPVSATEQQR